MQDDKVTCMIEAKKYDFNYWDGMKVCYGGYKFIDEDEVCRNFIKNYNLDNTSKVLDVGCEGFLLYEIKNIT